MSEEFYFKGKYQNSNPTSKFVKKNVDCEKDEPEYYTKGLTIFLG